VFDVAVDLRRSLRALRQWWGMTLSDETLDMLWIPPGFGHGFLTLSDTADFLYKVTTPYDAASDRSLAWNDPAIGIDWPLDADAPALGQGPGRAPACPGRGLPMKVLIAGSGGQLGRALQASVPQGVTLIAPPESAFDITDEAAVAAALAGQPPDLVINAAAYTAVDKAESEADRARLVNATAVAISLPMRPPLCRSAPISCSTAPPTAPSRPTPRPIRSASMARPSWTANRPPPPTPMP
jgi:hypothetical protein